MNEISHSNLDTLLHTLIIEASSTRGKSQPNIDVDSLPKIKKAIDIFQNLDEEDPLKLKYTPEELQRALKKIEEYFGPPTEEDIEYWLRH